VAACSFTPSAASPLARTFPYPGLHPPAACCVYPPCTDRRRCREHRTLLTRIAQEGGRGHPCGGASWRGTSRRESLSAQFPRAACAAASDGVWFARGHRLVHTRRRLVHTRRRLIHTPTPRSGCVEHVGLGLGSVPSPSGLPLFARANAVFLIVSTPRSLLAVASRPRAQRSAFPFRPALLGPPVSFRPSMCLYA
jgi:hypothetical protein